MIEPITKEKLAAILESHLKWWAKEAGGERADLSGANLSRANLSEADLSEANLSRANLSEANLSEANLSGADLSRANLSGANLSEAKISWSSHAMISEILWSAAADNIERQMLAAWIGRKTEWCWSQFLAHPHPDREWALDTLAGWVKDGDNAPKEIAARAKSSTTKEEEV